MLWKSQAFETVWRVTLQTRRDVEQDYIRIVTQLDDFYNDEHATWMDQDGPLTSADDCSAGHTAFFRQYFPTAYAAGSLMKTYAPLVRPVARKVSALFHEAPTFELVDRETGKPAGPGHPQQQLWDRVARDCELAQTFKEIQPKTWAIRTMFLLADWHPQFKRVILRPKTPDLVGVVEGEQDPADLWWANEVAVELPLPRLDTSSNFERRFLWLRRGETVDDWRASTVDSHGKPLGTQPYHGDGRNPYGRYPLVHFNEGRPEGIYQDPGDVLLNAQVAAHVLYTDVNFAARMLGATLKLFAGNEGDYPSVIPFSRDMALPLYRDGNADYISNNSDIGALWLNLQNTYALLAVTHGLTADSFALSGSDMRQALTALSKAADMVAEQGVVKDAAPKWERYVNDVFRLIRRVWNENVPSQQIADTWDVRVGWVQPQMVEDRLHQAQADQAECNLGAASVVAKIMERNRGIGRAEAEEIYLRNIEYKRQNDVTGERQTPDRAQDPEL